MLSFIRAKFLMASNINVTLTSINQERFVHESFGDVVLCPAGIARLLAGSNG